MTVMAQLGCEAVDDRVLHPVAASGAATVRKDAPPPPAPGTNTHTPQYIPHTTIQPLLPCVCWLLICNMCGCVASCCCSFRRCRRPLAARTRPSRPTMRPAGTWAAWQQHAGEGGGEGKGSLGGWGVVYETPAVLCSALSILCHHPATLELETYTGLWYTGAGHRPLSMHTPPLSGRTSLAPQI